MVILFCVQLLSTEREDIVKQPMKKRLLCAQKCTRGGGWGGVGVGGVMKGVGWGWVMKGWGWGGVGS